MLLALLDLAEQTWAPTPRTFLPSNATPYELVAEASGSTRFAGMQPTGVFDAMDPAAIPSALLPWLAWGLKLEIWDTDWSDQTKRWAIANSIKWHYLKGTLAGIEAYLSLVDTELVAAVVPPARTYLNPSLTAAQRAAYLATFPQLRVLPYVASAYDKYAAYTSAGYGLPQAFCNNLYPYDTQTWTRYTRTAELWENGAQVGGTLSLTTIEPADIGSISDQAYDQIILPVNPVPQQIYLGATYPGSQSSGQAVLGAGFAAETIINVGVTTDWVFAEERVTNQTVAAGLGLVDVTPTDVAQVHTAEPGQAFLTANAYLANTFMPPSQAWQFIYQLWYLFNPAYVPPSRSATTFLDWTRLGMPPYTAELQVNIEGTAGPGQVWGFVAGCLRPPSETQTQISDTLEAIRLSMSARDTILVNTTTVRPIQVSDALPVGSTTIGAWTAASP